MGKVRVRVLIRAIKTEERDDKTALKKLLYGRNDVKVKIVQKIKPNLAQIAKVRSEDAKNKKVLPPLPKRALKSTKISAEKIKNLIDYIVNDKMSVKTASKKAGMSLNTASDYYNEYREDPEHKIPLPKTDIFKPSIRATQQKIEELIRYIEHDKLTMTEAIKRARLHRDTANKYYKKYLEDPERKIPKLDNSSHQYVKDYTQEQISDLISYVVNDNISIAEASKKVNMPEITAKRYYLKYLMHPNHEIPVPRGSSRQGLRSCTNQQVKSLIGYLVDDGMTLAAASAKAVINTCTARKYYRQYLEDPQRRIPTPESQHNNDLNQPTVDQIKTFFSCMIIDRMSVKEARCKANISEFCGRMYYRRYLMSPNDKTKVKDLSYSPEKMKKFIKIMKDNKLSLAAAAKAVDLNTKTVRTHYKEYLKDPHYVFPESKCRQYRQGDIRTLINYIENEKMTLSSAAKKMKINPDIGHRYYKQYLDDPERRIPIPKLNGYTRKQQIFDKYARIVDEIYKSNPSIKPIYENESSQVDTLDIDIKQEVMDVCIKTESH